MKGSTLFLFLSLFATGHLSAQNAQTLWDSIKNHTKPLIEPAFLDQFDAPFRHALADYGWEDGLQISPNGLDLYALYAPMDLFSRTEFLLQNPNLPICDWVGNMGFLRPYASFYGMDLVTNPFGCDSFPNIDILYAHRNSVNEDFSAWQLSGMPTPFQIEAGPAPLISETDPGKLDLFAYTGPGDLWMIKNTTLNPTGISNAIRLPYPINPLSNEFIADNAFLARILGDAIILVYEKYTDPGDRVFMYTLSADGGDTWNEPKAISSITNSVGHIEHPSLYKDENQEWWLYFSIDYQYISRAKQLVPGDWDSWGAPENILSKGNATSLGEPTVTQNGDISFSLAYFNPLLNDNTDRYDIDPWFLPRKAISGIKPTLQPAVSNVQVYPNPANETINLDFNLAQSGLISVKISDPLGNTLKTLNERREAGRNQIRQSLEDLPSGVYCLIIETEYGSVNKLVVKQ